MHSHPKIPIPILTYKIIFCKLARFKSHEPWKTSRGVHTYTRVEGFKFRTINSPCGHILSEISPNNLKLNNTLILASKSEKLHRVYSAYPSKTNCTTTQYISATFWIFFFSLDKNLSIVSSSQRKPISKTLLYIFLKKLNIFLGETVEHSVLVANTHMHKYVVETHTHLSYPCHNNMHICSKPYIRMNSNCLHIIDTYEERYRFKYIPLS